MRVAIVGMGPSAGTYIRHAAGLGDRRKGFDEVWTVNAFGSVIKADRLFHMDDVRIQKIRADAGNTHISALLDYLQDAPGPIYTSRTLPKEPNPQLELLSKALVDLEGDGQMLPCGLNEREYLGGVIRWLDAEADLQKMGGFDGLVEFPLQEVINASGGPPYFTSTPAYAIALALAGKSAGLPEDVTKIALFGIDFSHINVFKAEVGRACCEFWLGRCMHHGIEVQLPEDTWILGTDTRNRLYGYDTRSISFNFDEKPARLVFKDKPAPTAAAIEQSYSNTPRGGQPNG